MAWFTGGRRTVESSVCRKEDNRLQNHSPRYELRDGDE